MSTAHYFHLTLYRFLPDARQDVVNKLKTQMKDASVTCWYDVEQEGFYLTCPSDLGNRADEALHKVIEAYVEDELVAAGRENRTPKIERFAESTSDALDIFSEGDAPDDHDDTHVEVEAQQDPIRPVTLYGIRVNKSKREEIILKPFKLRELPEGTLERYLAPLYGSHKTIRAGLTLRTARWDPYKDDYVFTGRTHMRRTKTEDPAILPFLDADPFIPLHDERDPADIVTYDKTETAQPKIATGNKSSIQQYLEDVEPSNFVAPNEATKALPSDAKKFLAQPAYQPVALGRTRVAKGASLLPAPESNAEESKDPSSMSAPGPLFASLLASNREVKAPEGAKMPDSVVGSAGAQPSFASLLASNKSQGRNSSPTKAPAVKVDESTAPTALETTESGTKTTSSPKSGSDNQTRHDSAYASHDCSSFPEFDADYTKIDTVGLTANATKQAQWELRNPAARKSKKKKHGIQRRENMHPLSSITNPSASAAAIIDSRPYASDQVFAPLQHLADSRKPQSETRGTNQTWANKLVQDSTATDSLFMNASSGDGLSVDGSQLRKADENRPVSLPSRKRVISENAEIQSLNRQRIHNRPGNPSEAQDASYDDDMRAANLTSNANLPPEEDDLLLEWVQAPVPLAEKKFTMRQKASKNRKKKKHKKTDEKTTETNPSEMPPVDTSVDSGNQSSGQPTNDVEVDAAPQTAGSNTAGHQGLPSDKSGTQEESNTVTGTRTKMELKHSSNLTGTEIKMQLKYNNDLPSFLEYALPDDSTEPVRLEIQLGHALLRSTDKQFAHCTGGLNQLCRALHEAGDKMEYDFNPRLTTSSADAAHLFSVFDSDAGSKLVQFIYEFHVKGGDGRGRVIRVILELDGSRSCCPVTYIDDVKAKLLLQYPRHVADAEVRLTKFDIDSQMHRSKALRTLVSSLYQPDEDSPLCYNVDADTSEFAVEGVYARRTTYAQSVCPVFGNVRTTMKVDQVWHLIPVESPSQHHNLAVAIQSKEGMIEQQRMWWECVLRIEASSKHFELDTVMELQATVDKMVENLDHVGFENNGPYVRSEMPAQEKDAEPEKPFW